MRTDSATIELSTRRLLGAAERGAGYLLQNLQPTGRFVARRNARTGLPVTGSYDPTQHFAALWALLDVRGHEPAVQAAAAEGVRWAFDRYYLPTSQGGAFRTNGWLVTGCSGAALLALDELTPERAPAIDLRPEIVDFLLAQQIAEGVLRHDFRHRVALRPFTLDLSRDEVAVHSQTAPQRSSSATGTILSGLVTYLSTLADSLGQDGGAEPARFALIYEAVGNAMAALCARNYGVRQGPPWMMYAIRRYAELVDRLLVAIGQADADAGPGEPQRPAELGRPAGHRRAGRDPRPPLRADGTPGGGAGPVPRPVRQLRRRADRPVAVARADRLGAPAGRAGLRAAAGAAGPGVRRLPGIGRRPDHADRAHPARDIGAARRRLRHRRLIRAPGPAN